MAPRCIFTLDILYSNIYFDGEIAIWALKSPVSE